MPKISAFTAAHKYHEESQENPLRWTMLFRESIENYRKQSGKIQCKDYFNDLVAAKKGKFFSVYGFDNSTITFNDGGLYVLLENISNMDTFSKNTGVFAAKAQDQLGEAPHFEEVDKTSVIVFIPNKFFECTYYISLLTWLIRCSNYTTSFESWDDFVQKVSTTAELGFERRSWYVNPNIAKHLKEWGFIPLTPVSECWYFAEYNYNNKTQDDIGAHTIHNNGFINVICACYNSGVLEPQENKEFA